MRRAFPWALAPGPTRGALARRPPRAYGTGPAEDSDEDTNEDDPGLIPTNTSNTISSKRKHEGDSDSAIKKYKKILKLLKMPVSEDDGSAKEDDAKNTELVNDNAEDTFDDVSEEEDALGGIDAFVSSSSELSSLSEHSDD